MRISPIVLLLVAMLGCGSGTKPSAKSGGNQSVVLPEPNKVVPNSPKDMAAIEAAIRKAAGKPTGELAKSDLEKVTKLDLNKNHITDLTPLAELKKLEKLHLDFNKITDLAPLAGLKKLKSLRLSYNKISDLKPLAGLTDLVVLDLQSNEITDLTPLAGLTKLKFLDLDINRNLTKAEVDKLQKALPKCEIEH